MLLGHYLEVLPLLLRTLNASVFPLPWKMFFTSDSTFFVKEYRSDLKFLSGRDGSVKAISMNGMVFRKLN